MMETFRMFGTRPSGFSLSVLLLAWGVLVSSLPSCVSGQRLFAPQIEMLALELAGTYPGTAEEVIEFSSLRSHRMNLNAEGLSEELVDLLEEEGPWHRQVMLAYLLALSGDQNGFTAIIDLLEDGEITPDQREGLIYSGMKFLGFTESDAPAPIAGWEADLAEWEDVRDRVEELGLHAWRLDYFQTIVGSGLPGSGDEALMAAPWLSFTLKVGDVPFLATLFGKGSPKCDLAILQIVENLLMRKFQPEEGGEGSLEAGVEAFELWQEENASLPPDTWITQAFIDAEYNIEDLFNQTSISKIVAGLHDNGEQWVLMRSHTLAALNRICGFCVDRSLIFESEAVRQEVVESYLTWYRELAAQVKAD